MGNDIEFKKMMRRKYTIIAILIALILILIPYIVYNNPPEIEPDVIEVKIIYGGTWNGTITHADGTRDVGGNGTIVFEVKGSHISATIKRTSLGPGKLTVQIIGDDKIIKERSTDIQYGTVKISQKF